MVLSIYNIKCSLIGTKVYQSIMYAVNIMISEDKALFRHQILTNSFLSWTDYFVWRTIFLGGNKTGT